MTFTFFGMSAVRVADVGEEFADEKTLNPDDKLVPLPRCLPMSDILSRVLLLRDRGRSMTLSLDRHSQETRLHVYIDNVGVIDSNTEVVARRMEEINESFERRSLEVHEQELHSRDVLTLDVVLDGQRQYTRISSRRIWKFRGAFLALTRRHCVSGRQGEDVIGHATFCGLIRRETLSVFCASYWFIRQIDELFVQWPLSSKSLWIS